MSLQDLMKLRSAQAFDPMPPHDELHVFHVPFEELARETAVETVLDEAIRSSERVAVIGRGGHGKSSLIAYATRPGQAGIAPIRMPVFAEPDETVTEPKAFAQHLIRTLTGTATKSGLISPEHREALLRASSDRVSILGQDVAHTRSATEVIDAAAELVSSVASQGLLPVVVLEDTDCWGGSGADKAPLVEAFFGRVIRIFADFPGALVVAVHEDYFALPGFHDAESLLETRVAIPHFDGQAEQSLGRILERRMRAADVGVELDEVFDKGALAALADYYYRMADRNLRKVIWTARLALRCACRDEAETVMGRHVDDAVAETRKSARHLAHA